jgi:hypothetical protein
MIVTKLKGGLGNQMFQYAVGRHLAHLHGTELKLDISMFDNYEWHDYSLKPFNILENFATNEEVTAMKHKEKLKFEWPDWLRRVLKNGFNYTSKHIREKHIHYDSSILTLPANVYLEGYWQSERYFKDIEQLIRREFRVKSRPEGKNLTLAKRISESESISLHIRRGNYVTDEKTNKFHGTCSFEYYYNCLELLKRRISNPHVFLFSDDPEWVNDKIKLPYQTTVVDHNDVHKDFEDLRLMSQCKYHIIANSTFSWWGAWLSEYKQKIVFCPRRWFASGKRNTIDLIPDAWQKI